MTYVFEQDGMTEIPKRVTKVNVKGKDWYLDFELANSIKRFLVEGNEDDAFTLIQWFRTKKE